MIKIVTVEREYGCGGGQIAQKIADRLGWKLWDQLLTSEIARLSNCDECEVESREERVDPLYYRLFKSILRGSFEGSLNVHRLEIAGRRYDFTSAHNESLKKPHLPETASSWAEARNISYATAMILCASSFMLRGKRKSAVSSATASVRRKPKSRWTSLTRSERRLFKNTFRWNGQTVPYITRCSTRGWEMNQSFA